VARRERDLLERAVHAVADHAKNATVIVDEAHIAGLDGSHPSRFKRRCSGWNF
jgi:hypothetical protein